MDLREETCRICRKPVEQTALLPIIASLCVGKFRGDSIMGHVCQDCLGTFRVASLKIEFQRAWAAGVSEYG